MDPKAVIESAGGRLLQLNGMKVPGFIDFEGLLTYKDGTLKFSALKLTTRPVRPQVHISANEGAVGKDQSHVEAQRPRRSEADEGLRMSDRRGHLQQRREIVRAPHKVEFIEGRDERLRRRHDLRQEARRALAARPGDINVAPDKKTDDPGAKITCGRHRLRAPRQATCASSAT